MQKTNLRQYMPPKKILLLIFSLSVINTVTSQTNFYDINTVPEIRIYFQQSNWDNILDSMFIAGQNERLIGSVVIDGQQFDSVGVRYKGYSSVDTARRKNPFNIDLDYIIGGQDYRGVTKLKLSNVIHDPSFIREVLSYEIAGKYMPAPKANFANVFVNDTLFGVYTNVESINNNFCETHFGSRGNSFFKCNPAVLNYPLGSNSNLQYYDNDTATYFPYYSLESDSGWAELVNMINVLNNDVDNIETVLNVDRVLWMLAFDYALVNLDSYIAYSQNYYLYSDNNHRFNPVVWDLNMSFGSFRFSDGGTSAYTGGITINQAKNLNPLGLVNFSVSPRPLIKKILQDATWKKMFMAHIRTIINENFASGDYYQRGKQLQQFIDNYVYNDNLKFYSYSDFLTNIDTTVGGSGGMMEYPGIKDLMSARTTYLGNYSGFQGAPVISGVSDSLEAGQVYITAKITGCDTAFLAWRYNYEDLFNKTPLYDDGSHGDGNSGDSIYGASIPASGLIQFYIYAQNPTAGAFSPERAEYEFHIIQNIGPSSVVINEVMADNQDYITDQNDEYEDWIELYNNSGTAFSLKGVYLSDDRANCRKWAFPDTSIQSFSYIVVWADSDAGQSGLHANFKLSKTGEAIFLSYSPEYIIDSVYFGEQITDISTGRYPNGTGPFGQMFPTIGSVNSPFSVNKEPFSIDISVFPNPVMEILNVTASDLSSGMSIELISAQGIAVYNKYYKFAGKENNAFTINVSRFPKGFYILHVATDAGTVTKKVIVR